MIVDRKELSRLMGLSISRIMQLAREGILTRVGRGRYDVAQCVQEYIAFKLQGGQAGSADVIQARTALYLAQVHKTELETERTRRETIPADIHVTDLHAFKRITNAALDGIDDGLVNDLADLSDPAAISDRMTRATNAVRTTVADEIMTYTATLEGGKQ